MAETNNTIRWNSAGVAEVRKVYADIRFDNAKTTQDFKSTAAAAGAAGNSLNGMGGSAHLVSGGLEAAAAASGRLNVGFVALSRAAMAVPMLAMVAGAHALVNAAIDGTKALDDEASAARRLDAVLKATGNTTGQSADEIQSFAEQMSRMTTSTSEDIRNAAIALATFPSIAGEAFRETLTLSQDAVAVYGGSLKEWLDAIARAVEDPVQGFDSLRRRGFALDEQQKQMAITFMETGETAKAQQIVLESLRATIGGAGNAAKGGLGGAYQDLWEAVGDANKALSEYLGISSMAESQTRFFTRAVNGLTGALKDLPADEEINRLTRLIDAMERGPAGGMTVNYDHQGKIDALKKERAELQRQMEETRAARERASAQARETTLAGKLERSFSLAEPKLDMEGYEAASKAVDDFTESQKKAALEAERMAAGEIEWQSRIATGWRDMYGNVEQASENFWKQVADDARKGGVEAEQADNQRLESIREITEAIKRETEMLGLSNQQRERAVAINAAMKLNASQDELGRINAAMDAKQLAEEAQKAADEYRRIFEQARDSEHQAWGDFWYDVLSGRPGEAGKNFLKNFASSFKRMWADLIAFQMQQNLMGPLMGAMGMGGAMGATAAFAGMGGSNKPGSASYMSDIYKSAGIEGGVQKSIFEPMKKGIEDLFGKGATDKLAGVLGTAVQGFAIGGAVGGGGMAAKALGVAGSFIGKAVGGPIGGMIGSVLGGLVGGLFASTPKSIADLRISGGKAGVGSVLASGGLDEKIGRSMGDGVANALNAIAEELDATLTEDYFLGLVGQRGKKFFYQAQKTDAKKAGKAKYGAESFEDAEAAIAAAIEAAIKSGVLQGLSDLDKKILEAAGTVEQGLQDVIAGRDFRRSTDLAFMALSDPKGAAMAALEDEHKEQVKMAIKFGQSVTKIDAIYAQKRLDLEKEFTKKSLDQIESLLTSLTGGSASPLAPVDRLALAQQNFLSLRSKALGGDKEAIGKLSGAATDFLDAAQAVYASSADYFARYNLVVSTLSQLSGQTNPLAASWLTGSGPAPTPTQQLDNLNGQLPGGAGTTTDYGMTLVTQGERASAERRTMIAKLDNVIVLLGGSAAAAQRAVPTFTSGLRRVGSRQR